MTELAGKTAWVTGAGTGIGRAVALALSGAGMRVALTGRREAPLRETAALLPGESLVVPADLTDAAAVAAAADQVAGALGGPDLLVNNAGLNLPRRYLHQLDPAGIEAMIQANLTAPFLTTVAVLPAMRERGGGLIVQIASMAGKLISFLSGPGYTAAKTGLVAFSAQVNAEQGIHGIRSTCVCPGEVATPILDLRPVPPTAEERARMLQPEDLAEIVLFAARMPPRVCLNEILATPTWNRANIAQAQAIAQLA
ncbi:SDR family NAD(P)-dependent oxidoreductase [Roseomonas sp. OT10]|uniref:SDR family oxidoreductase n=1 Tax=Roseomonas cutis TaxID=2897332 RepID=UPI001E36F263|nr:SDR family NAD(P)-dependent oxidoreductase [Roseomonas sp. OT10]UFN48348.1 SDR family NAD(P)-dependent oxidoreductase [Roseomonas sp. OT10]